MNLEQMKAAIKDQKLLGLEPYYTLKALLERQQSYGWGIKIFLELFIFILFDIDHVISGGQIFEEAVLQFIDCKPIDVNNPSTASPQEQLISTAKFNWKGKLKIYVKYFLLIHFSSRTNF
jgi:hypothetical protein